MDKRTALLMVVVLFGLGTAHAAYAQTPPEETEETVLRDEEGRMHLELGTALYRRGEFAGAATEFQAAYDASHRSPLLYNVYVAYRDMGDTQQAAIALEAYLRLSPEEELREGRLVLEQRLRSLIEAQEDGTDPPDGDGTNPHNQSTDEPDLEPPVAQPSPSSAGVPIGPVILLSVGGASIIGGIVTGVLALGLEADLEQNCNSTHQCEPAYWDDADQVDRLAVATDILLFGGAAIAVGGLLWWILTPDENPPLEARCDRRGCSATIQGEF